MTASAIIERTAAPAIPASFGRAAGTYRSHAHVQETMAKWLAAWLPSPRNGRALELGAGPGVFTRKLLPWAGTLVATDLAPPMCVAGRAALPAVEWRCMAAEQPEDGPWDWIFSSSMLQWIAEPVSLFSSWREQLAPGGRALGGIYTEGSLTEWCALAGAHSPVAWRSAESWRESLTRSGLQLVREASFRHVARYASATAFLRSIHGVGAAPERRLGPGQLRRLLRDYEARHRDPAGVRATWMFYRFEAQRPR